MSCSLFVFSVSDMLSLHRPSKRQPTLQAPDCNALTKITKGYVSRVVEQYIFRLQIAMVLLATRHSHLHQIHTGRLH